MKSNSNRDDAQAFCSHIRRCSHESTKRNQIKTILSRTMAKPEETSNQTTKRMKIFKTKKKQELIEFGEWEANVRMEHTIHDTHTKCRTINGNYSNHKCFQFFKFFFSSLYSIVARHTLYIILNGRTASFIPFNTTYMWPSLFA